MGMISLPSFGALPKRHATWHTRLGKTIRPSKFHWFTIKLLEVSFTLGFSSIRELTDAQFFWSFHLCKVLNIPPEKLCSVLPGEVATLTKGEYHVEFFWYHKPHKNNAHCITYIFWPLLNSVPPKSPKSHSCLSLVPRSTTILALHPHSNCRPFVFIVVWCIARKANRNGETGKHFHSCIKVLSQFRTPYCTNLRQESNRLKRGGAHDNVQIPYLQFSLPNSAPETCDDL